MGSGSPQPRAVVCRLACSLAIAGALGAALVHAQIPSRNVNMVSGTTWPDGDPFLQRQNEPSVAASTRNPLHLLAGSNDYRTVDLPGLPDGEERGTPGSGCTSRLMAASDGSARCCPATRRIPTGANPFSGTTARRPTRWFAPAPTA